MMHRNSIKGSFDPVLKYMQHMWHTQLLHISAHGTQPSQVMSGAEYLRSRGRRMRACAAVLPRHIKLFEFLLQSLP